MPTFIRALAATLLTFLLATTPTVFAADPTNPGYHSFARSLSEHKRNARKFHNYLNSKGIKK